MGGFKNVEKLWFLLVQRKVTKALIVYEIVAQSEDSVAGEHTNNQKNKGKSGQSKNLEFIMIDFI